MKVKRIPKRHAPSTKDAADYIAKIEATADDDLVPVLQLLDVWRYPRGDLQPWIAVLDRFDGILEGFIQSYDLSRLQINDFTPHTRSLIIEILRFLRLLFENCTNRKLFASYDRLYDLLLTNDLEILHATVALLLRPLQAYFNATPMDGLSRQMVARLLILARAWDVHTAHDLAPWQLASGEYSPPSELPSIAFYPPTGSAQITVDLAGVTTSDQISQLAETKGMSLDDQLAAWQLVRWQQPDLESRELLVSIRLLALACYLCVASEDKAQSKIFLYEPNLITQLGETIKHANDLVTASAISALDALRNHQGRSGEIVNAVTGNLSHGILMTLIRGLEKRDHNVVDATLAFIAHLIISHTLANLVIGAGIIPTLLELQLPAFTIRICGLLDALIFPFPQAMTMFNNADGVNLLVARIKAYVAEPPVPPQSDIVSQENLVSFAANPMKGLLRTMQRLMQSPGNAEGLRNLVDGDLPKAIKAIMEERHKFGSKVFSHAINIMATFIHNEPTSLGVIQELQLPQTLYQALEKDESTPLSVIVTVPNAMGAICLNAAGIDLTVKSQVIDKLINVVSEDVEDALDRDNISQLGTHLDELVRHHPPLRAVMLKAVMTKLEDLTAQGDKFVPEGPEYDLLGEIPDKSPENDILASFSRFFRLCEGLLRNATICKDFITQGGLDLILKLADSPCLPARFGSTEAALHLTHVLRIMVTHDHVILVERLCKSISESMPEFSHEAWMSINEGNTEEKPAFIRLRGAAIRLTYLGEALNGIMQHSRVASSLMTSLRSAPDFLPKVATMHKIAFQVQAALQSPPELTAIDPLALMDPVEPKSSTGAKFLSSRINTICIKFFKSVIRLLYVKRAPDAAHKREATTMGKALSKVLVDYLEPRDGELNDAGALIVVSSLLFDDRALDGHVQMALYEAFVQDQGLEHLLSCMTRIVDRVQDEPDLASVCGVRITTALLAALAREGSPDLLVRARCETLPLVERIWRAKWLAAMPIGVIGKECKALLTIIEGSSETESTAAAPIVVAPVRPPRPATADPARVDQLVEMGFDRGAAELALIRSRNNVAAATEMIFTMPHLFENAPPAPAPAPEPAPAAAEPENESMEEAAPVEEPAEVAPPINYREELEKKRKWAKIDLRERALELIDAHADLVFDLLTAFPAGNEGTDFIMERTDVNSSSLPSRLRLLVVFLATKDKEPKEDTLQKANQLLQSLPLDSAPRPIWISPALLLAEIVINGSMRVTSAKLGDEPTKAVVEGSVDPGKLLTAATSIVSDPVASRDDIFSALHLLAVLSRTTPTSSVVPALLDLFENRKDKVADCHSLLAIILRHQFENEHTLRYVMRREIRNWMVPNKSKVVDINHFARQLRPVALRNPAIFVDTVEEVCTLVDPDPVSETVYHIRAKEAPPKTEDFFADNGSKNDQSRSTIEAVANAMTAAVEKFRAEDSPETHAQIGLFISLLTELAGSYIPSKSAILAAFRSKSRSGVAYLVNELVGGIKLEDILEPLGQTPTPASRRMTLCRWAGSLLVALCADIVPTNDIKDISDDLVSIRKTVIDGIARSLKDLSSITDLESRYGKLWSLGDLLYRLLVSRPSIPPKDDESSMQIARMLMERHFVGLLTTAAGEVDLGHPKVKNVLSSVLKTMEYLSKESIKWGRAETAKGQKAIKDDTESDDSDVEMDLDDHDTPDLYRNSALGMLDAPNEDFSDDEEEEEDDEDMIEFDDDGMDDLDDDEVDTEPSGDEDDQDEEELMDDMEEEMGSDDEDEDDWTDEDVGPVIAREVVIGNDNEPLAEVEATWEPEGVHATPSVGSDEEQLDDPYGEEYYEGDEEDDMDMDIDHEEDYDEIDALEPLSYEDGGHDDHRAGDGGIWGWETPAPQSRYRSALMDDSQASAALFGAPPQPTAARIQHPLITPPAAVPPAAARRIGRQAGLLGHLDRLFDSLPAHMGRDALALLEQVIAQQARANGESVHVDLSRDATGGIDLQIGGRSFQIPSSMPAAPRLAENAPLPTLQRWNEEMAITPSSDSVTQRIVTHIINRLMPEAKRLAEEERKKQEKEEAEAEEKRKEEEEKAKKEEEEKRAKELEAAAEVALPASRESPVPEASSSSEPSAEDAPPEAADVPADVEMDAEEPSLARTIIRIHGDDIDITDSGIDLEFLQALPEELRADVVEQHLREQGRVIRPAAAAAPEASTQINTEFLNALPPEIRAEVLMQEALETARRSRPQPEARLEDPPLVVRNGDREIRMIHPGMMRDRYRPRGDWSTRPKDQREALQLLDRNGIASLVRLLFFPEAFRKPYLSGIMSSLCENSVTRADLLNLLLSVVQEGSGDLPAVDRSFQQMSIKPAVTPKSTAKSKAPESPAVAVATTPLFAHLPPDHVPSFIAQRCFEALSHVVHRNHSATMFFLTEHEQTVGLRKPASKKGKAREKVLPQTKYPIVILLSLLDRPVLLQSSSMLESFTGLLSIITKPLATMTPKKEEEEPAKSADVQMSEVDTAIEAAIPLLAAALGTPVTPTATAATTMPAAPAVPEASSSKPPAKPTITPPAIPANVLRLVVNCLTAGECTSKAFHNTLAVMQHLSCAPEGKQVILEELQSRCQALEDRIEGELASLRAALSGDGSTVDALTMSTFSPQTSSQAQLLRLLKTIEYLHTRSVDSDISAARLTSEEEAVGKVFASFNFDPMWKELGQCLTIVEEKDNVERVATILLPLVEALMIICKYRTSGAKRSPSLPPMSGTTETSNDLFVSFTTAHRKVLNVIVRNKPALLSGSFSLLIRNPRVLDFDNKRNWFIQRLKRGRDQVQPTVIQLNVKRQDVFENSFRVFQGRTGEEIKYGKLSVRFQNEDGIDAGGVTREWYSVLAQQIFDPNFVLFEPCAADKQTYQPNKASVINGELGLLYFKFVGRVIAKAVYDGRLLDAYFNRAFYKQILGRTVDMRDLESIDPEYHKSLQWMLDNDITGVIDQEFTIEDDQFGEKITVELKPGGASIPVTEENKQEYVSLVVSYRLENSIKEQVKAFLDGFYEIIPRELIQIFDPDQLELLISGITTIDIDELKNGTQMSGWKSGDPEIAWFWRALRSYSQEERARFLMFVTSSSRVPLGGFTQLQGASGIQPFQIQKLYAPNGSLPQASTCFNLLLLPKYDSYEQLRDRLLFAMTETGGFGKA